MSFQKGSCNIFKSQLGFQLLFPREQTGQLGYIKLIDLTV
jgi:hypothetical protein